MGYLSAKIGRVFLSLPRPGFGPRAALRWLRKGLLTLFLAALLLSSGNGEARPSNLELLAAPHRYSLVAWELGNLPDKWSRRLGKALTFRPATLPQQKLVRVQEFFRLGEEAAQLEQRLAFPEAVSPGHPLSPPESRELRQRMEELRERQKQLLPGAEETIEGAVSSVLSGQGLDSSVGVLPPVDAVFSGTPNVLVISPRDRIFRQQDLLLEAGLDSQVKEEIEARLFQEEDLSALVLPTGGVAVYPSVVSDRFGLRYALEITAHEWLHQWFFFRPLGRNFWSSPEMTTLNETAATIAGEELGDLAFTALTGHSAQRPGSDSSAGADSPGGRNGFDFAAEMRTTRARAEALLAQGRIDEAEAHMEQRRRVFVDNGYLIRKINQAYFAFHGAYATSGASTSPIGPQLRELRRRSGSLEDFIRTVAEFGSYQQFRQYLESRPDGADSPR